MTEAPTGSTQSNKRRRLHSSCDSCRKKKARCDSAERPGKPCTNCITARIQCTHARVIMGEKISSSPESPKTAQEHVATILSTTTIYVPPTDHNVLERILVKVAQYARSLEEQLAALQPRPLAPIINLGSSHEDSPLRTSRDKTWTTDTDDGLDISDSLRALTIEGTNRFYGHSSSVQFIDTAMNIHGKTSHAAGVQRPEFWSIKPWEKFAVESPQLVFPEDDLLETLIKIYFDQVNPIINILHFLSFHQSILDGLHLHDPQFGALVLMVCALASRYSDDPRVFIEGDNSEHSCGWKWYSQVRRLRATFLPVPSLYQLQTICLSIPYPDSSSPEESWILAGLGIRVAQGAGAHYRDGYRKMEPLTAELYRRAFWNLVVADTMISSFTGRPSITKPSELEVDLPVACDEEYWGIPNAAQPEGKPSNSAFMPVWLELMLIFGRIQRAVFSLKMRLREEIVELDSALTKWITTIPEHLRWDPHQQNQTFLDQSAILYSTYYYAQLLIHRPFIPAPGKEPVANPTEFSSFAVCANAARSCGHVLDVQARRGRSLLHILTPIAALFDSAVVLLVNVWAVVDGSRSQTPEDFARATADVQNCLRVLRLYEKRWRGAGRNCDILSAMLNIGKYTSQSHSLKRAREVENISTPANATENSLTLPASDDDSIPQQMVALERSMRDTDHLFSLPLLTQELGCLPVYQSFEYQPTFEPNAPYPIPLYLDPQRDLELLFAADPAPESIFSEQPDGITGSDSDNIQLPQVSFNIPMGDSWQDWSTYLANVDGLYRENF
ncbi:Fungal-trans domain-containing protein [Mycena venus]|uniref:Fungal-trans domain-containing protein n=1 Tax=Mycena venus TaxID=2733690 RepID=A0A8H7CT16_9AGAR|nr:Fungal-trans domain-containing protein [Mycena venus]